MTISDRIRNLRKSSGISQEELADKLNISRQSISKWESGQSVPDIEKIVLLSNYFHTTTDYIIKGTHQASEKMKHPRLGAATMGVIIGTALNAVGLILAITLWYVFQNGFEVGIGMIIMVIGTMLFMIGQAADNKNRINARRQFFMINVWILLFIPTACCQTRMLSPMPLIYSPLWKTVLPWIIYIVICISVDVYLIDRRK